MDHVNHVELSEQFIAARKKVTGRECGICSLCWRLHDVPEISKPKNEWCRHCRPGHGGCQIYDQGPDLCRGYACLWLTESKLGDEWFPAKAKIIADLTTDRGKVFLRFTVDPQYSNRWREEPYYSAIKQVALSGLRRELLRHPKTATPMHNGTVVVVKGKLTLILPDKDIPYQLGVVLPVGDDQFEFLPCKTDEEVARLTEFLSAIARAQKADPAIAHQDLFAVLDAIAEDPEVVALVARQMGRRTT
jgi:hypothetical protein